MQKEHPTHTHTHDVWIQEHSSHSNYSEALHWFVMVSAIDEWTVIFSVFMILLYCELHNLIILVEWVFLIFLSINDMKKSEEKRWKPN